MLHYSSEEPINLGGGADLSIGELAEIVPPGRGLCRPAGVRRLREPDGMPLKGLDSTRLAGLGWRPQVGFDDALSLTYSYQW